MKRAALLVVLALAGCGQNYGSQLWQKDRFMKHFEIDQDSDQCDHELGADLICSAIRKNQPVVFVCKEMGCQFTCVQEGAKK
jgi:hypothetical protein